MSRYKTFLCVIHLVLLVDRVRVIERAVGRWDASRRKISSGTEQLELETRKAEDKSRVRFSRSAASASRLSRFRVLLGPCFVVSDLATLLPE